MQEKFSKTVRKIAAIGTGMAMLGATLTGAMALDLSEYPAPFVKDGTYDNSNVFVVGEIAAASDTLGAVDIASNLQYESKVCTPTGGAVSVSGGVTEDIPLGEPIADSRGITLDQSLEDDDIDTLQDSTISFQSADYDFKDLILLGEKGNNVTVATSLTSSEDDYQTDVVLETDADAIKYYYAFDESILINATTTSQPLEIKFLGKTLKITNVVSATKFTAYVGTEYFMDVGDSVEVEGKTVTLDNVGSGGAIVVNVDGVTETIPASTTETVNGIEITNDETFYEDVKAQRSATLVVGKDAQETYKDGDAYVGEDKNDPDWVWDIGNLNDNSATTILTTGAHTGPLLGIENDFVWNDDSDNPAGVGECIELPNNYISICLDSLTVADTNYATYTFEFDNSADLSEAFNGGACTAAEALYIHSSVDEGFLVDVSDLTANGTQSSDWKTDKVWISTKDGDCGNDANGQWYIYYEDTNGKTQLAGYNSSEGGTSVLEVNYDNTKGTDMEIFVVPDQGGTMNLTLRPYDSTYLDMYNDNITMEWTITADKIASLGKTLSSEEAGELVWSDSINLGTKDEDHKTRYGVIIRDPKGHGSSDEVVLEIPGTQVKANVVVKGRTTTTSAAGESCTVADITPVTMIDAEIAGSEENYNLILVGGPCANKAVEAVADLGITCKTWDLKVGEGIVKLATNGDKVAMLVAGTIALDTRRAGKVVANYADYTLTGTEALVKGTTLTDITVE